MMSFLKEYCKRKKQERLAREIAARNGRTEEYEASRKEGVSPIEVLKDWELLTNCEKPLGALSHCEERSKPVTPSVKTTLQSPHYGLDPQLLTLIKEPQLFSCYE